MKLAAIVDDLLQSQSSFYLIKNFNKLDGPFCFYKNPSSLTVPANFSIMSVSYLPYFSGTVISTNIESAQIALSSSANIDNYIYLWDLNWMRESSPYEDNVDVLRNENLRILARSHSHKNIIENYCNREVYDIIEDWDYKKLKELC